MFAGLPRCDGVVLISIPCLFVLWGKSHLMFKSDLPAVLYFCLHLCVCVYLRDRLFSLFPPLALTSWLKWSSSFRLPGGWDYRCALPHLASIVCRHGTDQLQKIHMETKSTWYRKVCTNSLGSLVLIGSKQLAHLVEAGGVVTSKLG